MEKEGEASRGLDIGWNRHLPECVYNGRGRYRCAGSVVDDKKADGAASVVVATANGGADSALTRNVGKGS